MAKKQGSTYHVVHGTYRGHAPDAGDDAKPTDIGPGGEIVLTEEERKHIDPTGDRLASPDVWKKMQTKKALEQDIANSKEQEPSTKPGGAGTADDRLLARTSHPAPGPGGHVPPTSLEEHAAEHARRTALDAKAREDAAKAAEKKGK